MKPVPELCERTVGDIVTGGGSRVSNISWNKIDFSVYAPFWQCVECTVDNPWRFPFFKARRQLGGRESCCMLRNRHVEFLETGKYLNNTKLIHIDSRFMSKALNDALDM